MISFIVKFYQNNKFNSIQTLSMNIIIKFNYFIFLHLQFPLFKLNTIRIFCIIDFIKKIYISKLYRTIFKSQFLSIMPINSIFYNFINELTNQKKYKTYLKDATEEYDILKYKILNLTTQDIKKMYYKIVEKYEEQNKNELAQNNNFEENSWMINQLKIFVWVVVCYASQADQHLSSLNHAGWKFLISVFYFKPLEILQFQLLSLLKGESTSQSRKWTVTQNQLLIEIVSDQGLQNKWNEISKLFYLKSGKKYFRKPQKCREHWNNHLNPVISHEPWSIDEDLMLVEQVNSIGKKWSQISINLGGNRTQHMVKNRYKSLQKKFQVQILKTMEKQLKPSMLIQTKTSTLKYEELDQISMIKVSSQLTQVAIKAQMLPQPLIPTNIQQASIDQETPCPQIKQEEFFFQKQLNLIEVPEQRFFVKNKRSMGIMSQFDDENQKYVESFLF